MPVNNNRNQGVDSTEVIENYGKITGGAHNFGKIADSVIRRSLVGPHKLGHNTGYWIGWL